MPLDQQKLEAVLGKNNAQALVDLEAKVNGPQKPVAPTTPKPAPSSQTVNPSTE